MTTIKSTILSKTQALGVYLLKGKSLSIELAMKELMFAGDSGW